MTLSMPTVDVTDPALAAEIIGPIFGAPTSAPVGTLSPGDYLPPQQCLASTPWKASGFQIARSTHAVDLAPPGLHGRVLLLGPLGALHGLSIKAVVQVIRPQPLAP